MMITLAYVELSNFLCCWRTDGVLLYLKTICNCFDYSFVLIHIGKVCRLGRPHSYFLLILSHCKLMIRITVKYVLSMALDFRTMLIGI